MYFEYKKYLNQLLKNWLETKRFDPKIEIEFSITEPPPLAQALVGSNLAFIVSKKFNLEPISVCNEIVSFSQGGDEFDLVAADSGYINANPKQRFVEKFFAQMQNQLAAENFFNFEFTKTEKIFLISKNEDFCKLKNIKTKFEDSDLLMAFALLANNELSVDPYLKGLKGKENIPWLIDRFFIDVRKISQKCDNFSELASIALSNNDYLSLERPFESLENILKYQLLSLMTFRKNFDWDQQFSFSLRVINDFYAYYNQPFFRASIGMLGPISVASELLSQCVYQVVNSGLRDLKQSTRVLHVG